MDPNADEDFSNLSDDEIEARQRAEDGEAPDTNPTPGEDDPDGEGGKPEPTPEPSPEPTPEPTPAPTTEPAAQDAGGKVEGVASKDGTRVLPYAALQAERRSARAAAARAERAEREAEQLRQQMADIKAGKNPEGEMPTEEQIAQMEEDFPEEGKKWRALFNKYQDLAKQVPAKGKEPEAEPGDDPVQDAIDAVPLLLEWQHGDPEKFSRAVEHDALLVKSPKWKDKPAVERFAEATRRTAEEFDIAFEPPPKAGSSAQKTPAAKAAPATPADTAPRKHPETLSDFKGGSVADHGSIDATRASPQQLLSRMEGWTDEQIDAHLAKYG
jgi:hypothetical protein